MLTHFPGSSLLAAALSKPTPTTAAPSGFGFGQPPAPSSSSLAFSLPTNTSGTDRMVQTYNPL